jgi:hypothetical protein
MIDYFKLCFQYRKLVIEQRFNFDCNRAQKITKIYREMEALAYEQPGYTWNDVNCCSN